MKKKVLFIVNPFSGTSDKEDFKDKIEKHLDQDKFEYHIQYTEYAGHAMELSQKAVKDKIYAVVAVGGDGTINEVASQMVGSKSLFSLIPGGSGNGLANHFGMKRNMIQNIKNLNIAKEYFVDTCKLNKHFFINVGGIGFDAKVSHMIKTDKKRGFKAYLKHTFKELSQFKPVEAQIEIPELKISKTDKYAFMAVSNGSMYGYNFSVCPPARLDDGKMDVLLVKNSTIVKYLLSSVRALTKTIHTSNLVEYYQCSKISISVPKEEYIHVDGEALPSEINHQFEINPKSIRILLPETMHI